VQAAFNSTDPITVWNRVPPKPRRGTIAYADGTNWNPGSGEGPYYFNGTSWFPLTGAVHVVKKQIFTTPGVATYTPSANMIYCIVEAVGGGGGGGGVNAGGVATNSFGSGGGGSGGYSRSVISAATIGVSQTVTVGALGAGGAAGSNNGSAGGNSSLGALVVANGGGGGGFGSGAQMGFGGAGGNVGTGDIAAAGAPGTYGGWHANRNTVTLISIPGTGGSSIFGGGATNAAFGGNQANAGVAAKAYGSGGSGAYTDALATNAAGGNGSAGFVGITEFCSA
jgi:hypothetical protein